MTSFKATVYARIPNSGVQRVSPDDGLFYQASVAPSGDQILFCGGREGMPRIWRHEIGTDVSLNTSITPEHTAAIHPAFSWAGDRFAFSSDYGAVTSGPRIDQITSATRNTSDIFHLNIFVADPEGSRQVQITEGPFRDQRPTFSPDGVWIAFASNRSKETGVWKVPVDGSQDPTPVFTDHWGFRPWYTAAGKSILFYGPDGDRHRIWEVDVETGVATPVEADDRGMTHGPFTPPASPESVVVHSTRGGKWGIWQLPLRGSQATTELTPTGFAQAAHPSVSRDGVLVFDVVESPK